MRMQAISKAFAGEQTIDRRRCLRVRPPAALVKEIALWFRPPCGEPTMGLEGLGMPDVLAVHKTESISIRDISAVGLCLAVTKKAFPSLETVKCGHCYVYLKLKTPLPGKSTLRCLMLGLRFVGLFSDENRVYLRCQIMTRANPAGASKSFSLFKVEKVGVKEISVWCDEIVRMGRGIMPPITSCLDMENLLVELFMLQKAGLPVSQP